MNFKAQENVAPVKISMLQCEEHKQEFNQYCFKEEVPICSRCNEAKLMDVEVAPEVGKEIREDMKTKYVEKRMINPHEGHHMKPLEYVLGQAEE